MDVTHGFATTPAAAAVYATPLGDLLGYSFWVSDVGATTFRINVASPFMIDQSFTWQVTWDDVSPEESAFADKVRHIINADEEDISDAIVLEYVADAVAYVQSVTGAAINYLSCTALEEAAIKYLSALDCYVYLFGGDLANISSGETTETTTNMGYNLGDYGYRVGDASRNLVNNATVIKNLDPAIQIVKEKFDRCMAQLALHQDVEATIGIAFVAGESD